MTESEDKQSANFVIKAAVWGGLFILGGALVAGIVTVYNGWADRALQRNVAQLEERLESLEEDRQELEKEKQTLESDIASLRSDQQQLEADQKTLDKERQELLLDRQKFEAERRDLESERRTFEAETESLASEREKLQIDQQTLENEKADLQARKDQIESELQEKETELERLEELREIRARTLNHLTVTFDTTRDDKDDQDVVTLTLLKGNQTVATANKWKDVKLDNNSTHDFHFPLPPDLQFDDSYVLRVSKSGTDGWIFHTTIVGVFADGTSAELSPRSGEIHFENSVQSHECRLRR